MKNLLFTLVLLSAVSCISQNIPKDTLLGNVKKVREKVVFLTEIENPKLFYYDDDYGHSGFMGPESTTSRFFDIWYSTSLCYYLNYERHFNDKKKITKDIWFGKKDNFMESYRYIYDEKHRLISTIDSSEYSVSTRNRYFEEYGVFVAENIIYENLENNLFNYNHTEYKNGKIIISKNIDEYGRINEYRYHYTDKGKVAYRIFKNPKSWMKGDGNSRLFGVHDSIGVVYKDLINKYDLNNRLIETQKFDLYSGSGDDNIPVKTYEKTFIYEGDNLIKESGGYSSSSEYHKNYRYDKYNRLIEEYCCGNEISNSKLIARYSYKDGNISNLEYSGPEFEYKKSKISFTYKFDANKNWTEIIKIVDGKKLYKWIREIEYY